MWLTRQKANHALYLPLIKFIFRKNQYKSYGICYTCNANAIKRWVNALYSLLVAHMLFRLFKSSSALFHIFSPGQLNTLFWSAVNHTPGVIPIGSKWRLSFPTLTIRQTNSSAPDKLYSLFGEAVHFDRNYLRCFKLHITYRPCVWTAWSLCIAIECHVIYIINLCIVVIQLHRYMADMIVYMRWDNILMIIVLFVHTELRR